MQQELPDDGPGTAPTQLPFDFVAHHKKRRRRFKMFVFLFVVCPPVGVAYAIFS